MLVSASDKMQKLIEAGTHSFQVLITAIRLKGVIYLVFFGPAGEAAFKALMEQVKAQPMPNIHLRGHDPVWWSVLGQEKGYK